MKRAAHRFIARASRTLIAGIAFAVVVAIGSTLAGPRVADATTVPTGTPAAVESSATTPAPAPAPAPKPKPVPLQMARIGSTQQLVTVTGNRLGSTTGILRVFEKVDGVWIQRFSAAARFGKRGLIDGTKRREGSLTTPTGMWRMGSYVFGTHAAPPTGTSMAYRRMTWKSWWSSRRGKTYNTWVESRYWTGEHISRSPKAYEFAVSTGYNALPNTSVFGRGSGIFIHVMGSGLTAGCVSVSRGDMVRICRVLNNKKKPCIVIGTLKRGSSTSIWAY